MPAGTPAAGVLEASRAFAREQFALKHRYALVLHTDQPHPHVHLVVKAMSEQGRRMNIRKETLREWRDFRTPLLGAWPSSERRSGGQGSGFPGAGPYSGSAAELWLCSGWHRWPACVL